jgi:hypothetical protein
MQEWGGVEILSSGSAEGRYEQENHPGTEVQLLSALKASNPSALRVLNAGEQAHAHTRAYAHVSPHLTFLVPCVERDCRGEDQRAVGAQRKCKA